VVLIIKDPPTFAQVAVQDYSKEQNLNALIVIKLSKRKILSANIVGIR
jgi:hypothetical protein